ncbi:Piso0_000162 [Millerozyma farinosa CBS 7064]|uniref:Piso0_000162 protein n=1 Tax=Pichia sorbitophila (strain ATCC MYA-4447 / BCRC 22081 / CBS 7064 / NBRC 10061 / NRRL Y-12695) TaxID=559304 RepID=G8YT90_PICSO|nr:Piso0_000162 [Millerozyma farinosa CBS 7064]
MLTVFARRRPSEPPCGKRRNLARGSPACSADTRPWRYGAMAKWRMASAQANEDAAMLARCRIIVTFVIISVPRCTTYAGLRLQRKKKKRKYKKRQMLSNDDSNIQCSVGKSSLRRSPFVVFRCLALVPQYTDRESFCCCVAEMGTHSDSPPFS